MRASGWLWLAGIAACAPAGTSTSGVGATGATTPPRTGGSVYLDSGSTAELVEDQFVQRAHERVDLLYVVQDSAGATAWQDRLVEQIPSTFDWLIGSGIDYHVGVVTTDCDDPAESGRLEGWIDRDTPSPIEAFSALAELGEDGSPRVQPRGATYLALEVERDLANAGFYRTDAAVSVVVVGDGSDDTDEAIVDPAGFEAWFAGLKPEPGLASYACLLSPGATATGCADTAAALGGEVLSLDDPDASVEVGRMATGLALSWTLSRVPVPGTIEVQVESPAGTTLVFAEAVADANGDLVGDWTWDPATNAVSFLEFVPGSWWVVTIRYQPAG